MQDKERTLNYFKQGDNIIFTMDEVFRGATHSTRVALTRAQTEDLYAFLIYALSEEDSCEPDTPEYRFVEDADLYNACNKCVFRPDSLARNHHPCTPDERKDGKDGYWAEELDYSFIPEPTSSNMACKYCAFPSGSVQCYGHPCTSDERMDKLDGYWVPS